MTTTRTQPMDARRTLIADAAIEVLGTDGSRGLTHHAVDDRGGLPRGSTSYYCRTRQQLVTLTATRLVEIEFAAVTAVPSDVVDALAQVLVSWLGDGGRVHSRARLELFLLASRDEELATTMNSFRARFVRHAAAGLADRFPARTAELIVALMDGLVLAHCTFERTPMTLRRARTALEPLRTLLREPDR